MRRSSLFQPCTLLFNNNARVCLHRRVIEVSLVTLPRIKLSSFHVGWTIQHDHLRSKNFLRFCFNRRYLFRISVCVQERTVFGLFKVFSLMKDDIFLFHFIFLPANFLEIYLDLFNYVVSS